MPKHSGAATTAAAAAAAEAATAALRTSAIERTPNRVTTPLRASWRCRGWGWTNGFKQLFQIDPKGRFLLDIPIGLSWLLRLSWNISWVKAQDDTDMHVLDEISFAYLGTNILFCLHYIFDRTGLIMQVKQCFFLTYCAWACVVHNTFRRTNWFLQAVVSAILAFSPDISLASFFWGLHQKVA